jgi:polyhydroxybutyrate depolymerase
MTITEGELTVAGRPRTYTLVTPPGGYDRLLLVFHGSRQNAGAFRSFTGRAFDHVGDAAVAYLDGFKGNWNDSRMGSRFPARVQNIDDVAFAEAAVEQLGDGRPAYAAGYSNGGGMVIRLLHERPDLLDGGAVIAAQQPAPDNFVLSGLPVVPKPVLFFHGTKDRVVPYGGGHMPTWARYAFKVGGAMLSAPDTAAFFAARNGITAAPVTADLPYRAGEPGRTSVSRTTYRQDGHAPVTLYTVHGGGHTIPGATPSPRLMGRTATDVHVTEEITKLVDA